MKKAAHIEKAIQDAYNLESLLRIASMAVEGEQITGKGMFEHYGGGSVISMAADLAGEIIIGLEYAGKASEAPK